MDGVHGTGGGGSGGPAPFLLKTYEMVDDSSTDDIVSWSSSKNSFVVWNPPEFSSRLLPAFFKHNNFSSFIRQLNTYGFRKIDPERWEFGNEDFVKDQKHNLKNIHRRKPIHSHSQSSGSLVDAERAALDEEIDRISCEKAGLESNLLKLKQERSTAKLQLEDLTKRIDGVEKRQENLLNFFDKALQNPTFVEHLLQKIESMDLSAYNKKRRLPEAGHSHLISENNVIDNGSKSRPEFGNIFQQDFSNKLRLELSPAVSDINLVSQSTQSTTEDEGSPPRNISGEILQTGSETLVFSAQILEPSDTGTSFTLQMDSSLSRRPINGSTRLHSLQPSLTSSDEGDGQLSCHLNLTLASSSLHADKNPYLTKSSQIGNPSIGEFSDTILHGNGKQSDNGVSSSQTPMNEVANLSSSKEVQNNTQAQAPARVNDVFWEQFLTERPGCSDNEEAISNYRSNACDDQEDRRSGHVISRDIKNMNQLKL